MSTHALIIRRRRHDDDYRSSPLDLRLTVPAVSAWVLLLVVGGSGVTVSTWISVVSGIIAILIGVVLLRLRFQRKDPCPNDPGEDNSLSRVRLSPTPQSRPSLHDRPSHRAQHRDLDGPAPRGRHSLFPRGSLAAALLLTSLAVSLVFASLTLRLTLASRDPLAVIGANPSHRFNLTAQVVSTPKPLKYDGFFQVDLRASRVEWRGRASPSHGVLQVRGKGWQDVKLGSWVTLRTGLAGMDPRGRYLGFAKSPTVPQVIAHPNGRFVFINAVRTFLAQATAGLSPGASGTIQAMTLGLTTAQDSADRDAMQMAGLSHLTAVSGLHLGVVLALALGLTARCRRRVQVIFAIVLMVTFLAMLEGSPSVVRAATMGGLTLIGLSMARPARSFSSLSVAVLGMLLIQPFQAVSWGFALSAFATASIVSLGARLAGWFSLFLPRLLAFPLAVSISAQLACAPLLLLMRGSLQVYSLPANLLAGPIASVVTVGGLVLVGLTAVAVSPAGGWPVFSVILDSLALLSARIAGAAAGWINGIARFISGLPGAEVGWLNHPVAGVIGLIVVTVSLAWVISQVADVSRWRIGTPPEP